MGHQLLWIHGAVSPGTELLKAKYGYYHALDLLVRGREPASFVNDELVGSSITTDPLHDNTTHTMADKHNPPPTFLFVINNLIPYLSHGSPLPTSSHPSIRSTALLQKNPNPQRHERITLSHHIQTNKPVLREVHSASGLSARNTRSCASTS